ncbi:MAG: CoA transferase, partial [Rhodospirillales bacterium]|nr:CoA transferase [Rhodospirillales bacterium]
SPNLPNLPLLLLDTNRGKRSAFVELREPAGRAALQALLAKADIFMQGYRPGGLADLGFRPQEVARQRPGIVYVSLSAYGSAGPWAGRRGFDSLVQTASGFNHAEAAAAGETAPRPLPCQALDHASGYLLAFGALTALHRRATEGGSWHVEVSLARTGRWIRDLGRVPNGLTGPAAPARADIADLLEDSTGPLGHLSALRHAAQLSETPTRWDRSSAPLGGDAPEWAA